MAKKKTQSLQSMNEELQTVNQENRHKMEELAQLSDDLQNLMAATDIATLFLDRELRILRFTPKVAELFNARMVDRGRPISDLTHHLGYPQLISDAEQVLQRLTPIEREVSDEGGHWYLTRVLPYRNAKDRIEGVVITFVEITQRKRAEEALQESEKQLATELAAMKRLQELVARLLVCPNLHSALEEVLVASIGIAGAEMGTVELLRPEDQALQIVAHRGFQENLLDHFQAVTSEDGSAARRAMKSGKRVIVEDVQTDPSYEPHRDAAAAVGYRTVQATPLKSRSGELLGVLSTHYPEPHRPSERNLGILDLYARQAADFIERVRNGEALRKLNEQLERRVADRTAELERQNRQLRKLAMQLTKAEQGERRKLAKTLHDGLQQILVAGKMQLPMCTGEGSAEALGHLENLLDEAINASRSLSYELSPPALHTSELPESLEWLSRWFHDHHHFEVKLEVAQVFPTLQEDIKMFLFNSVRELLLNSVKHSGGKAATVELQESSSHRIRIAVTDEGHGFDAIHQLDHEDDGAPSFGLFSIQERLTALGGSLHIESSPHSGAKFVLNLPLTGEAKRPEETRRSAAESFSNNDQLLPRPGRRPPSERPIRVLVVDDHGVFRQGLILLIEREEGMEVIGEACDGLEAVERMKELEPDVVLMDVDMPHLNGVEATRRIKRKYPETLIIGLSFHEDKNLAEEMCRAGASTYIQKGGDAKTLFATIHELFQQQDSRQDIQQDIGGASPQ